MKTTVLFTAALLTAAAVPAMAVESEDIIKYRESVMEAYAGHTGASSRIVRGKVAFDDQLKLHTGAMLDIANMIGELFPEGSDFGVTRAKEEVWSDRDGFSKAVKDNQVAAQALVDAVAGGDKVAITDAFMALTDTCKSCHEKYRTEEE